MSQLHDATLDYSKKLCETSRALLEESRIAVAQSKEALARWRLLRAQIKEQKSTQP
ncbi:MAG TPA: hypothetical protein VHV54_20225 [Candidatus Binatia bacterium]|nr:hypothetical protein [Candidatus Binatia bacterium]